MDSNHNRIKTLNYDNKIEKSKEKWKQHMESFMQKVERARKAYNKARYENT